MADDEKKIIIDEDWKAQVQREKEEAATKASGESGDEESAGQPGQQDEEASFLMLLQSLATQCMFALGLIAQRGSEQVMVDLGQSKYIIDTLVMLREKTQGNLTDEEKGALAEALSELQRVYVMRAQQAQEAALQESGIDMNNLKNPQDMQ